MTDCHQRSIPLTHIHCILWWVRPRFIPPFFSNTMMNTSFFNLRQGPEKRFLISIALLLLIVSLPVNANKAPQAVFTVEPTSGPAPLNIQLDASASSDSDGGRRIIQYEWASSDGQSNFCKQTNFALKSSISRRAAEPQRREVFTTGLFNPDSTLLSFSASLRLCVSLILISITESSLI